MTPSQYGENSAPAPTSQHQQPAPVARSGVDRTATFKFYNSTLACQTDEFGILSLQGAIRWLETQLRSWETVFVISKKGGALNLESDFYEPQQGLLCAVHAAHNSVGSADDPALSRDAFTSAAEAAGRLVTSGNYGDDEITACLSASKVPDILCVGNDVASLMKLLARVGSELCGFVVHQP